MLGAKYFLSTIQNYVEYFIKKHEKFTNNPLFQIYINKIENRVFFEIKSGCYLELSVLNG